MATPADAVTENVPGPFFVDSTCIDCDTCRQLAPATFGEAAEYSFVQLQPRDNAELRAALHAQIACPTASIGGGDKQAVSRAVDDFPLPVAPGVSYCGFTSRNSFGASSYFVEHPAGNWLIDSPRFVERLARAFESRGGICHIFLTHRDDVADAAKYAARFGAERIIHRHELSAQPDAERVLDGRDPILIAPDFHAIPTPGHTKGHCVLLYDNRCLFAGDHIWYSRARRRLNASRDVCWYNWPEQIESVALLTRYTFEWLLPGHGERIHLPAAEMQTQLATLAQALRRASS
jgi:glyoxylase-like metal-dependent hydrolase (beta-lactamase superfamily II)/ferredoxin